MDHGDDIGPEGDNDADAHTEEIFKDALTDFGPPVSPIPLGTTAADASRLEAEDLNQENERTMIRKDKTFEKIKTELRDSDQRLTFTQLKEKLEAKRKDDTESRQSNRQKATSLFMDLLLLQRDGSLLMDQDQNKMRKYKFDNNKMAQEINVQLQA